MRLTTYMRCDRARPRGGNGRDVDPQPSVSRLAKGFVTMINMKRFLTACLGLLLAACSPGGLRPLVLEGRDLHPSLVTRQLDGSPIRHVPSTVLRRNPQHSADPEFVKAIASSGSQGNLGPEGIRSALYALYLGEGEVGLYGLEASSAADARRLENALREIWARNASLDRARVHRGGRVLVVVWTDGLSPEVWEAVNRGVVERLPAPRK